MNITVLRTFLAIIETGNLVRAAERLNVTQSTVTARLKSLEGELGQTLLYRHSTPVQLTPAGLKFRHYADAMASLWEQARQQTALPSGIDAVCNLACNVDLWPTLGRRVMCEIHQQHPSIGLSAWPGGQQQLDEWLSTGLVDVALSHRNSSLDRMTSEKVGTERLVLVSTQADSPIRFDPGYIYVDAGEEFGRRHAAAYADAGIAKVSFGSAAWALDYLLDEGGSAYLPERLAEPLIAAGRLHVLEDGPVFERSIYLITSDASADTRPWLPELVARCAA